MEPENGQPQAQHEPEVRQPEPEEPGRVEQTLARDVAGLIATADQHGAELRTLSAVSMLTAFAFGVLAAIVFLQHRQVKELARAIDG
ncbi:MAG TPA: hypothetical protein VF032_19510 [Thermoleophilaceae bacterium]